jgi:prevent-host-death family protein
MDTEPTPNRPFVFLTATELRDHISEVISRARYGNQLVIVTRHSSKVAAIVSYQDVLFLETMKRRRAEVLNTPLPDGSMTEIGRAIAERGKLEELFM